LEDSSFKYLYEMEPACNVKNSIPAVPLQAGLTVLNNWMLTIPHHKKYHCHATLRREAGQFIGQRQGKYKGKRIIRSKDLLGDRKRCTPKLRWGDEL
jgi:hypothetical protein